MVDAALIPPDEADRLEAVRSYEILDTPAEPEFDDLAQLAAAVCAAPMASVTLIDAEREWSKARVVFPIQERPRNAFCAHAVLQPDVMIVTDASTDERFSGLPVVIGDPFVRFYAGVPLISAEGFALGVLCVLDVVPRDLSQEQKQALRSVARQVVALLEARRAAMRERRRVAELQAVHRIGASILRQEDLGEVLSTTASAFRAFVGSTRAVVLDYDPEIEMLEGLTNHGIDREETGRDVKISIDDVPSAQRALMSGRPEYSDGFVEQGGPIRGLVGTRSHVCIPLLALSTVFGVVFLDRPEGTGRLSRDEEDTCASFAALATVAIEHAHRLVHAPERERLPADVKLTEQETAILRLAAEGLTNPVIGERLFLSRHTVKEYLGNAMRKLGASSRVEAVMKAARLGLIEAEAGADAPPA